MPNEAQGAVLLNSGYEVLGRILAGDGQIKFTRAALDGGDIPEGVSVESLTQPVKFERNGLIVSTDNTGDGEATVVVQTSSIGLEAGLSIKGVMLFVEDPTESGVEVAYSYLPLQEDPVWVRPEGDAVSKLVTFEIINVISSASSVVAIISPDGLARAKDLHLHNTNPLAHEGIFPRIGFVAGERVRESWRPGYGLGGGGEEGGVVLEVETYTGTAKISAVVSGTEYDAKNLSEDGAEDPNGTLIIKKLEE